MAEIEREAFSTLWPPTAFKRELQDNKLASYLVVYDVSRRQEEESGVIPPSPENISPSVSTLQRLVSGMKRVLNTNDGTAPAFYIAGFAGLWVVMDEAHVTTIAVRESLRHQGLGELLLIALIDLAMQKQAQFVTLEVRATNAIGQALYQKFGFVRNGIRPGYYTDNHEDAIIMSTERITSAVYQQQFQHLKEAHFKRWPGNLRRHTEESMVRESS
ncbi:MAG: ribosomal protein S18-alanine N-acetyltransferase [Chloroflexi bacterium]|nr:ribosomal protein S18-alanine N-acetyltransferase [Chloroflexota bacterium]